MENKKELRVRAVLLDLDGTLVDSHAAVRRSWQRWADEVGIPLESFWESVHGRPGDEVMAELLPDRPAEQNAADNQRMIGWELADTDGVRALPGAGRLTGALTGWPWAIVTACPGALAEARIAAADLPTPSVLVTADQLAAGKPDPEGYLTAAERLGVHPESCVVFEDAPAGVRAGLAAGMAVIGLGANAATADPTWLLGDLDEVSVREDGDVLRLTTEPLHQDSAPRIS